jgi:1,4-alpha-glucan branching enzyme
MPGTHPDHEEKQTAPDTTSTPEQSKQSKPPTPAPQPAKKPAPPPPPHPPIRHDVSLLSDDDVFFFNEGSHYRLYTKLGAHPMTAHGVEGTYFAVWAPGARQVQIVGNFNNWQGENHALRPHPNEFAGIWEGFIPGMGKGDIYKYHICSQTDDYEIEKADPLAFFAEVPPQTASVVWDLDYRWNDAAWMEQRGSTNHLESPFSIYEVHTGSWRRVLEENNRSLSYRELAPLLTDYVKTMGFTHVEFLPIMEHPFFGSWGYQVTGYFAPTSRYGTPQDFMYLVDYLHQHGIGVILDWVPSHFPSDGHGLSYFDGTHLYEHADPRQGWHPDWNGFIYNYGRYEVRSFLMSSAFYWLDYYHIDGLRVDGVASMLYLDYSRKEGEWIPNKYGSKENLEAIEFLRRFNQEVYKNYPDVQTIAEESTAWKMVSRPIYIGGLGFGMKWDMGWMHDTLAYMSQDPVYRKYHHDKITFRLVYAFSENFVLSLSHDEVVHGKASLLGKMPGDMFQKFANLRLLFGMMYAQPGKKLLFMGGEFGQWSEWNHDASLEWHLQTYPPHSGVQKWVRDLNHFYRHTPALHQLDCFPEGFEWIDCNDWEHSIISMLRKGKDENERVVVVFNATPVPRFNYRVGVPRAGFWREVLNSDAAIYEGSNIGNAGGIEAEEWQHHGRPYSLQIALPSLSVIFFKWEDPDAQQETQQDEAPTATDTPLSTRSSSNQQQSPTTRPV